MPGVASGPVSTGLTVNGFSWPPGFSKPVLSFKSSSNFDRAPAAGTPDPGAVASAGPPVDLKCTRRMPISFAGLKIAGFLPRFTVTLVNTTSPSVVVVV